MLLHVLVLFLVVSRAGVGIVFSSCSRRVLILQAEAEVRKEVEHSSHWHWNASTAKTFKGHFQLTRSLSQV